MKNCEHCGKEFETGGWTYRALDGTDREYHFCDSCMEELLADRIRAIESGEFEPVIDESMDGDHESALRDAGWGTDEDYGMFSEPFDD